MKAYRGAPAQSWQSLFEGTVQTSPRAAQEIHEKFQTGDPVSWRIFGLASQVQEALPSEQALSVESTHPGKRLNKSKHCYGVLVAKL